MNVSRYGEFIDNTTTYITGHHVYKDIWKPDIGDLLSSRREKDNPHNEYAVCIMKESVLDRKEGQRRKSLLAHADNSELVSTLRKMRKISLLCN